MSDWFTSLGPVVWFGEQFTDASAWSVFRLMLLSWVFAAAAFIGLDRLGAMLLGRSRPLAHEPPERARSWRWGTGAPPPNYSLLPPGTMVESTVPVITTAAAVDRPLALMAGDTTPIVRLPDPALPLDDEAFWRLFADDEAPIFGFENGTRLSKGEAPERYNPVTGYLESLQRDQHGGTLHWEWQPDDPIIVGPE